MEHCVMSIVLSLNMDKNVSLTVDVIIHMAAHMSQGSVSASQVSINVTYIYGETIEYWLCLQADLNSACQKLQVC